MLRFNCDALDMISSSPNGRCSWKDCLVLFCLRRACVEIRHSLWLALRKDHASARISKICERQVQQKVSFLFLDRSKQRKMQLKQSTKSANDVSKIEQFPVHIQSKFNKAHYRFSLRRGQQKKSCETLTYLAAAYVLVSVSRTYYLCGKRYYVT